MTDIDPTAVANAFVRQWEAAWNTGGAVATARLYTSDAALVGASISVGRPEIERLLGLLHHAGWTRIAINVVNARSVRGLVLAACEFTAHGSGAVEGKELKGRSSHVLVHVDDAWLSTMHSAA